jgi:hypothetical protein
MALLCLVDCSTRARITRGLAWPKERSTLGLIPAEIAGVIAHLLSDASRLTSGAAIPVYGRA